MARHPAPACRQRGAALLAFFLIVFVLGAYGLYRHLTAVSSNPQVRAEASMAALAQAREALLGFAATYDQRNSGQVFGQLPCPDTNNDGEAEASCGTAGTTVVGLLPWKTLGLPMLQDEGGECLWYAVGRFKNSPKSTPLNWDSQGQFAVRSSDGSQILTEPENAEGGAVAVLFAPGIALGGQHRSGGSGACPGGDSPNAANYLDGNYSFGGGASLSLTQGTPGSTSNNDLLLWLSSRDIFQRIKQRSDFPSRIDTLMAGLKSALDAAPSLPAGDASSDGLQRLPAAFDFSASLGSGDEEFRRHWDNQLRYLNCGSDGCLTVRGKPCRGALIFTGERATTGPRTTAESATAASFLAAANIAAATATDAAARQFPLPQALAAYDKSQAAGDVVLCLKESVTLNFSNDLGAATAIRNELASGNPTLAVDSGAGTATLGTSDVPIGSPPNLRYGCLWFNQVVRFGSGLRAFFEYRVQDRGDGFTFTIADAERNPDASMCGAPDQHLGYSGEPTPPAGVTLRPIAPPKLGLEFDFVQNLGYNESNSNHAYGRQDPLTIRHLAFTYWGYREDNWWAGVAAPLWDDNVHGFGSGSGDSPRNPAALTSGLATPGGLATLGQLVRIRLEISRNYDSGAGAGTYDLKAWAFPASNSLCFVEDVAMADLSTTFAPNTAACSPPTIRDTISISDFSGSESLRNVRLGFTTGFGSGGQLILLQNFKAQFIP